MNSGFTNLRSFPFSILWALALFLFLWTQDYPKPMADDLYYAGAGLNLAKGGDFSNPLIERQKYPSHFFFVYPPLHSYALAGWLKLLGIRARTVTAFYLLMYLATAVSGIAILRMYNALPLMEWLIPLGVCTALLNTGMRSEAVSVGFTMAGFALFEGLGSGIVGSFLGFLLMVLGASAAPRLACFSGALFVFSLHKLWTKSETKRPKFGVLFAAAGGTLLALVLFLAMIQFRVGEFWHSFHTHAELLNRRKFDLFLTFINENPYLNGAQAPLVWTLGAMLLFAWPKTKCAAARVGLAIVAGFVLETLAGGLGAGTLWYVSFALLLLSTAAIRNSGALTFRLGGALVFLFLLANVEFMIAEYQALRGRITSDRGGQEKMALELRSTIEHPVLVDSFTARYIYDYRIPSGFIDIQAAATAPKAHVIQEWRSNDIYVIGPGNVNLLNLTTSLEQPVRMRAIFGLANRHMIYDPCRVYVIPAERCLPKP